MKLEHESWKLIEELFEAAAELKGRDREDYLAWHCRDQPDLRQQLEELLAADANPDAFLAEPLVMGGAPATVERFQKGDLTHVGRYKLLQEIGEGGFGVVYMAEQHEPVRRKVALKIIKPGMDSRAVVARFEAERQALAMMDHPNIARVLDGGTTDSGTPYFVMDLVKGIPITDYCNERKLSTQQRLELFSTVCGAIQHAHHKGIIHRDIKPSNVMVTLVGDQPVPKVIDFGVAKALNQELTEKTLFTNYGAMIGTPQYMSPEQAAMSGIDVDTRSDVYSLGILLYELLTGRPPFDDHSLREAGLDGMRKIICESEPVKPSAMFSTLAGDMATEVSRQRSVDPSHLSRMLKGDLDWIVMKCLEKDRGRRYESPNALSADIERYLNNEPVQAGPPRFTYQVQKLYRRHRAPVLTAIGLVAILCCTLVGTTWAWMGEKSAKERAEVAEAEADKQKVAAEENAEKSTQDARRAQQALEVVTRLLSSASPSVDRGADTTVKEFLDAFAGDLKAGPIDDPHVELPVRMMLAAAYDRFAEYDAAQAHYAIARQVTRQIHGRESIEYANLLFKIAMSRRLAGLSDKDNDFKEAIEIANSINAPLSFMTELLTEDGRHRDYKIGVAQLRRACDLVEQMTEQERSKMAVNPFEVLSFRIRYEDPDDAVHIANHGVEFAENYLSDSQHIAAISNLSECLEAAQEIDKAFVEAGRAVDKAMLIRDGKQLVSTALRRLDVSNRLGDADAMETATLQAHKLLKDSWSAIHEAPEGQGFLIGRVAGALHEMDEPKHALGLLELSTTLPGHEHAHAKWLAASSLRKTGDLRMAITLSQEAVNIYESKPGKRRWFAASALAGLGREYAIARNFDQAFVFLQRAVATSPQKRQVKPQNAWLQFELAVLLSAVGRDEEAAPYFGDIADATRHQEGYWGFATPAVSLIACLKSRSNHVSDSELIQSYLNRIAKREWPIGEELRLAALGLHADKSHKHRDAFDYYLAAEQLQDSYYNWYYTGWIPDRLVELAAKLDRKDEIIPVLDASINKRDEQLKHFHPERAYTRIRLAEVLLSQGTEFDQAEELLKEAQKVYEYHGDIIPTKEHEQVAKLLEQVNELRP